MGDDDETPLYFDERDAALDACVRLQAACAKVTNRVEARAVLADHVRAAAPILTEIMAPAASYAVSSRDVLAMRHALCADETDEPTDAFDVAPPSAMLVLDLLRDHGACADTEVRDDLTMELARWIERHREHELWLSALLDADRDALFDALGPFVTRYAVESALRAVASSSS